MDSEERHDLHIEAIMQVLSGKTTIETVRVFRQWYIEEPENTSAMRGFAEAVYDGFSRNHECLHFASEAQHALEKALRLNPKDPHALRIQASWAYVIEEDKTKAREYAQQYLTIVPQGPDADVARKIVANSPAGGCFIATAVYGSTDCSNVVILKTFRDEILLQSRIGKGFIRLYYTYSPAIANMIRSNSFLRIIIRNIIIWPLVIISKRLINLKREGGKL